MRGELAIFPRQVRGVRFHLTRTGFIFEPMPMQEPRWLSDEEQALWRLMLVANRKVSRVIEDALQRNCGLTASEFAVLVTLEEGEEAHMRLRDVSSALDWDRSRTSHQITRMERRGLVAKGPCGGDARGVLVSITDKGRARLQGAASIHVESVRRVLFDEFTPGDVAQLTGLLAKICGVDEAYASLRSDSHSSPRRTHAEP